MTELDGVLALLLLVFVAVLYLAYRVQRFHEDYETDVQPVLRSRAVTALSGI